MSNVIHYFILLKYTEMTCIIYRRGIIVETRFNNCEVWYLFFKFLTWWMELVICSLSFLQSLKNSSNCYYNNNYLR